MTQFTFEPVVLFARGGEGLSPPLIPGFKAMAFKKHICAWIQVFIQTVSMQSPNQCNSEWKPCCLNVYSVYVNKNVLQLLSCLLLALCSDVVVKQKVISITITYKTYNRCMSESFLFSTPNITKIFNTDENMSGFVNPPPHLCSCFLTVL